jgi:hypothetical protein
LLCVSDAGSTPPPPPPPNLTPPPGYAAYEPTLAGAVSLRRVQGLRTAIVILLGVYAIGALVALFATPVAVDAARKYLDSARTSSDEDDFLGSVAVTGISGFLTVAATIAIVVLSMIWLYRIVGNHRAIGRRTSWSTGWAIGGWFVPPLIVYAVPMLVLRESWKASDAAVPPGDDRWRQNPVNPIVYVWWVLYGLAPIVFIAAGVTFETSGFGQDPDDLADSLIEGQALTMAQSIVGVLSAIAWALLVRGLTARHVALTGETRTR